MKDTPEVTWPYVSVIVPVYNDEKHIAQLLESILAQDYPSDLMEIIVIDNNSTDSSKELAQKFPVTVLEENEIQNSSAARNKGVRCAKGQVLAFIDSDCTAEAQWLRNGVSKLFAESVDMVGGQVKFTFSAKQTAAECYDSLTNFDFESKIRRQVAGTGNLFVKAEVFGSIGLFPENVKGGGDVHWTQKATQNGFSLIYVPDAIVYHPARLLGELIRKLYRVGGGMGLILIDKRASKRQIFRTVKGKLKPYRISFIKQLIAKKGTDEMNKKILRIWLTAHVCRFIMALGIAKALFHKRTKAAPADVT